MIVLNKPAGLASQGGKGIAVHLDGMLDALRFEGTERPKLVHRLDRDTSGVLLLARGVKPASKLAAAFRGRDVEKTYWALLWGVPDVLEGRIDLPLVRVELGGTSRSEPAGRKDPEALKAVTDYKILDYAGKKFAWAQLIRRPGGCTSCARIRWRWARRLWAMRPMARPLPMGSRRSCICMRGG